MSVRRLPVYILLDTSGSMRGEPIHSVNVGLQAMLSALRQDPYALESVHLSIITFDVEAREYLPLTPLDEVKLGEVVVPDAGATFLGAALQLLLERVDRDIKKTTGDAKGDWRPLLFVMTDGSPSDLHAYREAIPEVKKRNFGSILACAAGPKAKQEVLLELTDRVVTLDTMDSAAFSGFFKWVFTESRSPFFDKGKLSHSLIDEFCQDKEVQFLTFEYVRKLGKVWGARFPGKGKLVPKVQPAGEPPAKTMAFPPLAPASQLPSALPPIPADAQAPVLPVPPVQAPATGGPVTTQPTSGDAGNSVSPATPSPAPVASQTAQSSAAVPPAPTADSSNAPSLKPGQIPATSVKPAMIPDSKPTFHLPNCKVGTAYSAKIEGTDKSGRQVVVADLRFPDGFGLTFDVSSQMVTGQPLLDGEFDLDLQWSFSDAPGKVSGTCRLTSNPDPRSLWKVIEPADDLPYRKAHLDQKLLKGKGFSIVAASRRGRSHEHGGSFRDDDFFISDDQTNG